MKNFCRKYNTVKISKYYIVRSENTVVKKHDENFEG